MKGAHVAISAVDVEESIAFYSRLGFSVESDYSKPDGYRFVRLSNKEGFTIELVHSGPSQPRDSNDPMQQHIGLRVDDLKQVLKALQLPSERILVPITPGKAVRRYAFVADPCGNAVELFEAMEPAG